MRKRKFSSNEPVNDVFIVETIRKKKIRSNKEPLYFIKWKDWDDKFNTWEPQSNILDKSLIDIFEEEQREKNRNKKDKELEIVKDSKLKDIFVEPQKDVPIVDLKLVEKPEIEEKFDKISCEIEEVRPKICLKIPKHRIQTPCFDNNDNAKETDFYNQEIEKSRKYPGSDDDWRYSVKFSPNFFPSDGPIKKPNAENPIRETKLSQKIDSFKNSESILRKPRKLLSINEYSAKMKKHHKKSKHDKLRSDEKRLKHFSLKNRCETNVENKMEQKSETKTIRPTCERPLISLENKIETWSKKSLEKDVFSETLKEEEEKPTVERFKYHANTIVTDVTVQNLSITIREMEYEDFIDSDVSRYLKVKVPLQSDWLARFRGSSDKTIETNDDSETENVSDEKEQTKTESPLVNSETKIKLFERFSESVIPSLRPPSRPRSVDSYKTVFDRNFSDGTRNPFSATTSPMKTPVDFRNQHSNTDSKSSPLQVIIDDCEEVDVVGGIESDSSFVGSLQSETVTMSTQIRQSLPTHTSAVTSIIQSLLQSYSYNHSMVMPPLQAAPWIESQIPSTNAIFPHHNNNDIIINTRNKANNSNISCLPLSNNNPIDQTRLKYRESACLSLYHQPTTNSLLSDIYHLTTASQDMPIDLSFK